MFLRLWLCFLFAISLWNVWKVESYEEFCDEPHTFIFCNCDIKYKHTIMSCFIFNRTTDEQVWVNMGKVDNVVTLQLLSRLPFRVEELPSEVLKSMTYLETLKVTQANLTLLKSNAISELKVLRELDLRGCEIKELQSNAISNLPKLNELTLSENLLEEVLSETFTGLLDLQSLHLDQNKISRIEGCAFCDLQNLQTLELWSNEITDLTQYMFRGLRYLKRLDLSKNKISILNDKLFHTMPKLNELDLSNNLIHYVGSRAFQGLKELRMLIMRNNTIKMLPDRVFTSLPDLRNVDLYKNKMEAFQVEILERMDNVRDPHFSLDIKGNPLICDCRLSWVKKYLKFNTSHLLTGSLQQLECRFEESNTTAQVYKLDLKCAKKDKKQNIISMTTVATVANAIPHKIRKHHNKTRIVNEDTMDDVDIAQDSELEHAEELDDMKDSSFCVVANFNFIFSVVILNLIYFGKRDAVHLVA